VAGLVSPAAGRCCGARLLDSGWRLGVIRRGGRPWSRMVARNRDTPIATLGPGLPRGSVSLGLRCALRPTPQGSRAAGCGDPCCPFASRPSALLAVSQIVLLSSLSPPRGLRQRNPLARHPASRPGASTPIQFCSTERTSSRGRQHTRVSRWARFGGPAPSPCLCPQIAIQQFPGKERSAASGWRALTCCSTAKMT